MSSNGSAWVVLALFGLGFPTGCGGGNGGGGAGAGGGGQGGQGGSGGGGAPNATPPADVCALLTQADIQTILPDAEAGVPETVVDTADIWVRICKWQSASSPVIGVELVIDGAITQSGRVGIGILTDGPGDGVKKAVSGLGDKATFWDDAGINTLGLVAKHGDYAVDVTAYFVEPPPTEQQLVPLVQKAIDGL